jgi:hypothetical protein
VIITCARDPTIARLEAAVLNYVFTPAHNVRTVQPWREHQ